LLSNLAVSDKNREAGLKKFNNVVASLNRRYYDHNSETLNGIVIGSWGKKTQIAPPRDVDVLFLLPDDVYFRFQQRSGNRQSQLLQQVKDALFVTNSRTIMRADRHTSLCRLRPSRSRSLSGSDAPTAASSSATQGRWSLR
jgi:hypothetical protein